MQGPSEWLIDWMVFYTIFNIISVISQLLLTLLMSFLVFTSVGWGSEVPCLRTFPQKFQGSSAAQSQDPWIAGQTPYNTKPWRTPPSEWTCPYFQTTAYFWLFVWICQNHESCPKCIQLHQWMVKKKKHQLHVCMPHTLTLTLLMATQEAFVDSVDQRSDCTECAVWSLIYTVHIFILVYY